MVGELVSDDGKCPWFLLLMFLPLPFAISLSLVLPGLAVSDCGLFLLHASCVSSPGRKLLSGRNLYMENCGIGLALGCRQKPEGSCTLLILGVCVLMALGGSFLGHEFEEMW